MPVKIGTKYLTGFFLGTIFFALKVTSFLGWIGRNKTHRRQALRALAPVLFLGRCSFPSLEFLREGEPDPRLQLHPVRISLSSYPLVQLALQHERHELSRFRIARPAPSFDICGFCLSHTFSLPIRTSFSGI
jgi:hypothetical protein